jgi:hypothetical protein
MAVKYQNTAASRSIANATVKNAAMMVSSLIFAMMCPEMQNVRREPGTRASLYRQTYGVENPLPRRGDNKLLNRRFQEQVLQAEHEDEQRAENGQPETHNC